MGPAGGCAEHGGSEMETMTTQEALFLQQLPTEIRLPSREP